MEQPIFNETNIPKAYFRLVLPNVLSMMVTLVYNLADTFFVAQTNDTNLVAGVSLGMPIFTILMAVGNIFGQGGSSLISRLLGQREQEDARRVSSFCFYATLLLGIVFAVLMLAVRVPALYLLGASENTFRHLSDYYFWLALGAPLIMLNFIHSNLLRAEGRSKEAMVGIILGSLVNIVLDPIFISGLGMGAAGAAIATVIGYLCSDAFCAAVVATRSQVLSIDPRKAKIPPQYAKQVFGIGIPAALSNVMSSVSSILVNQFLLPYGDDKIAAMGLALKVSMIVSLLLTSFSFGSQPMFGYYYGAKDDKRFSALLHFCLKFICGLAVVLSVLVFAAAPLLIRCFMDNDSIIHDGAVMLRWQVVTMVFVGLSLLITIVFQATGKAVNSFILSISRQGVVFFVVLAIAYPTAGYNGVIASQAIADVLTAGIALALLKAHPANATTI